jgi:hypothetical protein
VHIYRIPAKEILILHILYYEEPAFEFPNAAESMMRCVATGYLGKGMMDKAEELLP